MKHLLPFDEINRLEEDMVLATYEVDGKRKSRKDRSECIDDVWELLCLAYLYGTDAVAKEFGFSIEPNNEKMNDALFRKYNGKDFRDRIGEYYDTGDYEAINRVIETETHRMYNDGVLNAAYVAQKSESANGKQYYKRWETMLDDRVRDTHDYLEGVKVPLDSRFYTYDGDSARYPGDFSDPSNNINCRCVIGIESA